MTMKIIFLSLKCGNDRFRIVETKVSGSIYFKS